MKKRGFSGVIGVVLIVFLVIVAIALVWLLVSNSIRETKKSIDAELIFYDVKLSIVEGSVIVNGTNVTFLVEREPGGEDIVGFLVVLKDNKGNGFVSEKYKQTKIAEFQRIKVEIFSGEHNLVKISEIEVYGIIESEGETIISNEPLSYFDVDRRQRFSSGGGGGSQGTDGDPFNPVCGNGNQEGSEECDDGNDDNFDECTNACLDNICGDGLLDSDSEQCDDGNLISGDLCSSTCTIESCRDNSDPLGLANGVNVLFIDQYNCNCTNPVFGNGAAARTQALNPLTPWCSFTALNWSDATSASKILAGDSVYIRGGTYLGNSGIRVYNFGTLEDPITISGYSNENVFIKVHNSEPGAAIRLIGTNFTTLQNLKFIGYEDTLTGRIYAPTLLEVVNALNFSIIDSLFFNFQGIDDIAYYTRWDSYNDGINRNGWGTGVHFEGVKNGLIENVAVNCSINPETIPMDTLFADGITVDRSKNFLVKDSFFGDCGHIGLAFRWSNDTVSENNFFYNRMHTAYGAIGWNHTFRDNIIYNWNVYPENGVGGIAIEFLSTSDSKIHNNIIYYNESVQRTRNNYGIDLIGNNDSLTGGPSDRNEIYHNLIYVNDASNGVSNSFTAGITPINRGGESPNNYVNDNKFYNNIIKIINYGNVNASGTWGEHRPILIDLYGFEAPVHNTHGNEFKNNIFFDNYQDHFLVKMRNLPFDSQYPYVTTYWNISQFEGISTNIRDNLVSDPNLVNPDSANFNLQSSSPGRNAGIWISGFHCPSAGATGNCRTWYGSAPDIGVYEFVE